MRFTSLALAALLTLASTAAAAATPTYPPLTGPVVDVARALPAATAAALDAKLRAFRKSTGHQLQVAIVPDMGGATTAGYAEGLFRAWKLGRAGADDGILLLQSTKERAVRIQVGRAAEGYLTDAASSTIVDGTMLPLLRQHREADAITAGVDRIMKVAAITPEQRAEDDRRVAARAAADHARHVGALQTALAWILGIAAAIGAAVGLRRRATRGERARRNAEAAAAAQADAARRERDETLLQAARQRIAARTATGSTTGGTSSHWIAAAPVAAAADDERRRADERRREDEEDEDRRNATSAAIGAGLGSAFGGSSSEHDDPPSSSSSDDSPWSGGGGDSVGGGADGNY